MLLPTYWNAQIIFLCPCHKKLEASDQSRALNTGFLLVKIFFTIDSVAVFLFTNSEQGDGKAINFIYNEYFCRLSDFDIS